MVLAGIVSEFANFFPFRASRLGSVGGRSLSDTTPRPEPNEDAFDDDTDKEVLSAVNFKGRRGSDIDEDEEGEKQAEAENSDVESGNSSNSSDEEDLQSPVTIRQQRTHQAPMFLNATNGRLPFVKPVDTCESTLFLQTMSCFECILNSNCGFFPLQQPHRGPQWRQSPPIPLLV